MDGMDCMDGMDGVDGMCGMDGMDGMECMADLYNSENVHHRTICAAMARPTQQQMERCTCPMH